MNVGVGRLNKELKQYSELNKQHEEKGELGQISLFLRDDSKSLYKWYAKLKGPNESPFENGIFIIQIDIPNEYPMKAPNCKFITKIFHPNINFDTGEICHELLKDKWLPSCSIETVCRMILDLMMHPNADSPLNCDAGNLIRYGDLLGFKYLAQMYTIDYALNEK